MCNIFTIVGRLVAEPSVIENEKGLKEITVTIAVVRNYKNADGEYEFDTITCKIWNGFSEYAFCHKGDLVGIKGRIQSVKVENEDGTSYYKLELMAEKVTFLSSKKEGDTSNENN